MIIAVDLRLDGQDYQNFIYQSFSRIAKQHPQDSFIFIVEKEYTSSYNFTQNIIPVILNKPNVQFLKRVITDQKMFSILKKYKADLFVSSESLTSNIPECLIFNKKYSARALRNVKIIVTSSHFLKQNILSNYKIEAEKIDVINIGADEIFQPIEFEKREKIKEQYAEGKEYFLFSGAIQQENNLLNLLKAFSFFKKRQKSTMQLLIASTYKASEEFKKNIKTYRFLNDVKVLENLPKKQLAEITASAYATVDPSELSSFTITPLEAMKCDVPIIISNTGALPEIVGDAALYINPRDHNDIAEKMMLVFKDEKLRSQLIAKGREQIKKYSWDSTAEQLWQSILKTLH